MLLQLCLIIALPMVIAFASIFGAFAMRQQNKEVSYVEEDTIEMDLDKIIKNVLRNEVRKPLYRTGTVAGYRP